MTRQWTREGLAEAIGRKVEGTPAPKPFSPTMRDYEVAGAVVRYLENVEPEEEDGVVRVEFKWANEHGLCQDCGDLPASYLAPDLVYTHIAAGKEPVVEKGQKLCPLCAALHASHGERLERLWQDEPEGEPA